MKPDYLASTEWLEQHLNDANLRVFDCTVNRWIDEEGALCIARGDADFKQGHIPGAAHLDLVEDLSAPDSDLRFTLPSPERFAEAVARKGVSDDSRVIVYGTREVQYATRVWWMFRVFGFDNVAVLDGGWQAWTQEGRPVTTDSPKHPRGSFSARFRPELLADKAAVQAALQDPAVCIINALAPDIHSGATHIHYGPKGVSSRPGRIPASVNVWSHDLIDPETNKFLPLADLEAKFAAVGVLSKDGIVTY